GSGIAIADEQVVLRKSLAELASALNGIRSAGLNETEALNGAEHEFAAALARHAAEFAHSPGKAWLDLTREDFAESVRLRRSIAAFDAMNGPARRSFVD